MLTMDQLYWLPGTFEVIDGIVVPKHWAIPEILESVARENAELQALEDEGLSTQDALSEYLRRQKAKKNR
jgi:hypothetical protein